MISTRVDSHMFSALVYEECKEERLCGKTKMSYLIAPFKFGFEYKIAVTAPGYSYVLPKHSSSRFGALTGAPRRSPGGGGGCFTFRTYA
eukprot:SAG22_NODE_1263_length_4967_cov_5.836278_3_plen_89_part_00